jgi:hypothetical protein
MSIFGATVTISQHDGVSETTSAVKTLADAYGNHTYVLATAPSGGAWTLAKVNALNTLLTASGAADRRFTTVFATVDYTVATPVYDQDTFRGRNDDGNETAATWKAAAGADFSQNADDKFRLRFLVQCTVAGAAGFKPTIYYRKNSGAGYGAWAVVSATFIIGVSVVARANSTFLTHGADTTQQLGAGTFIADNNGVIELGALNTLTTEVNKEWEVEVVLFLSRTQNNPGDLFQFKITNDGVDLDTYTDTPIVTVADAPPPFSDVPLGGGGVRRLMLHLGS